MSEGMLSEGRIPMNVAEEAAYLALVEQHGGEAVSGVTRRDPLNTGPLLVEVDGQTFQVDEAGQVSEL
jgi:hypothetical protein